MRHYFQLQLKLVSRQMRDFGIAPVVAYPLLMAGFLGLSAYLFYKTSYAPYAYLLAASSFLASLSERGRNEFLQGCFPDDRYRPIRLVENMAVSLPFIAFLVWKNAYWQALALFVASTAMAFVKMGRGGNLTLPTPFGKRPFEFVVGFRKTFYLHLFAYFLAIMAIAVQNFNLGIFALVVVYLICLTYYSEMEIGYYVWVHIQQPRAFLLDKIKTAMLYSTLLSLPLAIGLGLFFVENMPIIAAFMLLGYLYLTTMILAKYAAYPNGIGLPQSLLLAVSFTMPPMLLVAMPFFYKNAVKRLKLVLG